MSEVRSDSRFEPQTRRAIIGGLVLVHCALVPIAIYSTLQWYGFANGLTLENQQTWTPIIGAQSSLLVLYFVFGSGSAYWRGVLFFVGITYVMMSVVWAYSKLSYFPEPVLHTWIMVIRSTSIWLLLPALSTGIILLPLRGALGSVQVDAEKRAIQFRIADMLATTFLVAFVLAWYKLAITQPLREAINFKQLALSHSLNTAASIGCFLMVLCRRWWSIGCIVFIVSLIAGPLYALAMDFPISWRFATYPWVIIVTTLGMFRWLGYRLAS